jgi:hypothetical protein
MFHSVNDAATAHLVLRHNLNPAGGVEAVKFNRSKIVDGPIVPDGALGW